MPSTWTDIPVQSSVDSGMYTIVNEIVENCKVVTGSSSETPPDSLYGLDARLDILEAKTNLPIGQTVLTGRISSLTGLSNFLEKSTDGNYLKLVSSSGQIVSIAFGAGFSTDGFPLDYIKVFSSQQNCTEWGSTADGTYYVYVERNSSDGSTTCGQSTIAPLYDYQKSTAGVANTHSYIIPERKMYYDDGSSWVNKQRVFVGEYVCTAGAVSSASIITYALRGRAFSSWQAVPAAAGSLTWNHNLGIMPHVAKNRLKCSSAESGYAANAVTEQFATIPGAGQFAPTVGTITANTISVRTGSYANFQVVHSTSGTYASITSTNWNIQFSVERGF
jgi:hypothetical protein